jgi:hypothetical protein
MAARLSRSSPFTIHPRIHCHRGNEHVSKRVAFAIGNTLPGLAGRRSWGLALALISTFGEQSPFPITDKRGPIGTRYPILSLFSHSAVIHTDQEIEFLSCS